MAQSLIAPTCVKFAARTEPLSAEAKRTTKQILTDHFDIARRHANVVCDYVSVSETALQTIRLVDGTSSSRIKHEVHRLDGTRCGVGRCKTQRKPGIRPEVGTTSSDAESPSDERRVVGDG